MLMIIAINLSPIQIKQHSLTEAIHSALDDHGLDANCLELEITESAMIEDDASSPSPCPAVVFAHSSIEYG
jgi:EAL domain-containing protein (putative c-di-GMP-specific phosphodiesterase class I)